MKLDTIERAVQWAGAAGAFVSVAAVVSGVVSGSRHARGEATEDMPGIARPFVQGSARAILPSSVLGLALLYAVWRPIVKRVPEPVRAACLVIGSLLYFPGLAIMMWGRLTMGNMHNVSTGAGAQLYADHRLVASGPFGLVRHPMYVGGIMAEIGALLLYRTWTTLLITLNAPLLPARARREEELLASHFGAEWEEYSRRVPAWVPCLRGSE